MKQQKMCSFDYDIIEYLKDVKPNASGYIQELIYADIKQFEQKKKPQQTLNQIYSDVETQITEREKIEIEKKDRQAAWDSMPQILKDEVMSYNNWGEKWRVIFYPIYKKNGTITSKEFREVV